MSDYPKIRASNCCPLCDGPKAKGLVACWPCYRACDMGNGLELGFRPTCRYGLDGPGE